MTSMDTPTSETKQTSAHVEKEGQMNNYQWLLQMDGADRKAWFDAEHVETEERALDGGTEPQSADSRERLEADIGLFIASYMPTEDSPQMFSMICSFIDRQAEIVRAECEAYCAECSKEYYELQDERDELQERLNRTTSAMNRAAGKWAKTDAELRNALDIMRIWISDDAHLGESAISYEFEKAEGLRKLESIKQAITVTIGGLEAERDNWKANCEDWKKHARAAENACYETMLEREDYRKKFGKCIDYADAIHALMDDEGMA